ncbi:MAG: hypothetical protein H0X36_10055, partial [Sphingomonadaceae bacterium]|nr:hypothetical protein [Sphingomonadaceae bacterium]
VIWGIAIGVAALAGLFAARAVLGSTRFTLARTLGAFVAAFAAYEALLYAFALVDGGLETFSADIVAKLALSDALWLAALLALRAVLTLAAPRWFAQAPAARAA